jgi:hypothetical protein
LIIDFDYSRRTPMRSGHILSQLIRYSSLTDIEHKAQWCSVQLTLCALQRPAHLRALRKFGETYLLHILAAIKSFTMGEDVCDPSRRRFLWRLTSSFPRVLHSRAPLKDLRIPAHDRHGPTCEASRRAEMCSTICAADLC